MLVFHVSYFLMILLSVEEVYSQVCVTQAIVTKKVMGTYSKSNREIYGFNARSRLRTRIIERWITQTQVQDTKVCCDGYSKEYYNIAASDENCKPICKTNCTNGYCKEPEKCACNAGYTKQNDTCEPSCERGCLHGTCVAPDTCQCDSGYNLVNNTCQPVCTHPCHNGICVSPETCKCFPGYEVSKLEMGCQPHCPGGCPYRSYCESPGICKCESGWRLHENNSNYCAPVCKYPCGNGTCVYRDLCYCFTGFQIDYFVYVELEFGPVCKPICKNSKGINCVAPKKCIEKYEVSSTSNNEDTTTTTKNPYQTMSTDDYNETTTTSTTTTTVPYLVNSSNTTERVVDNDAITNVTSGDPIETLWIQQHGMFILLPIMLIVTTGLIVLLIWKRTPTMVINFFKRRSYNVEGASVKRTRSGSFESLQFIPNESES